MTSLIDTLLEKKYITREQLEDARDKQIGAKKPIHELLVEMGFIREEDLVEILSKFFGLPVSKLDEETIDPSLIKLIPYEAVKRYGVFPVRKEGDTLVLAMSNPQDVIALDDIRIITKTPLKAVLSTKSEIDRYIEKYYQSDDALYDLLKNIVTDAKVEIIREDVSAEKTVDTCGLKIESSPVVRLVDLILSDALKSRASDVHIEPHENFTEIRYRIDGDLNNIMKIPAKLHSNLAIRIKIMTKLDIAEKRKPQDGRASVSINGRDVDIRVSIVPTVYGEKIVLRLLDVKEVRLGLDKIGFSGDEYGIFVKEITRPQGMILVTGPTGSGKTSTLYAALNYVKSEAKNIITIEDPVEYLIDGINQIQVDPVKNITFTSGLKSILRQDPNVILVGEIRDRETAEIAFRSSLTGHLVFSTLHTNNAVATITRLRDIGLEPYLIASSVILVVAQRLVKVICPYCKEEYQPDSRLLENFGSLIDEYNLKNFYRGRGCERCDYRKYLGRTGIFEMLRFDEKVRSLVSGGAVEDEIYREAQKMGMRTLVESGVEKVAEGLTTLEEIAKVIDIGERMPPSPVTIKRREKPLILIVDDEEDIRKVLKKRLSSAGYEVITAENGREALKTASRESPDLIVMDVMMPEMDGFEATRALRSKLETAVIPIVMLTAKRDKESELKGIDAGADDYITKPFDKDKLLARIDMLLRRRTR